MLKDQVLDALTLQWGYSPIDNRARCPAHKGGDRNLHVYFDGKYINPVCFSKRCSKKQIFDALGVSFEKKKFTPKRTEYVYKTTKGRSCKHVRIDKDGDKDMRWYPAGFVKNLPNDELIIPYSAGEGAKVLIVEGEKALHACQLQLGKEYTIITWGALSPFKIDWSLTKDKEVYLWPDNDMAGFKQMEAIASHIKKQKPTNIYIVQIQDAFEKEDAADFVQRRLPLSRLIYNNYHEYFAGPIKPIIEPTEKGLERAFMFADLNLIFNDRRQVPQISGRKTQINPLNLQPDERIDFESIPQSKVREALRSSFVFIKRNKDGPHYMPAKFTEMDWRLSYEAHLYNKKIDPFLDDYLDKIKPKENYNLLDNWADDLYEITEKSAPFSQWFSRYFFLGIYQRTINPGCKMDTIPVISGEEDAGKSSLASNILPPDFQESGIADIELGVDAKEFYESIQGKILVEAAEISGYSKQDQNKIKANLTRQIDTPRLTYGRIPITSPRRVIIFATSNEATPLMNTGTGNRRFCVIEIIGRAKYPLEDFFNERRDDLFAAAKYAYNEGARANFPRELALLQKQTNEVYQASDLVLEQMLETTVFDEPPPGQKGYTLMDITNQMFVSQHEAIKFARDSHHRLIKAMKKQGWTRDEKQTTNHLTGKRTRLWHPLNKQEEATETKSVTTKEQAGIVI